MRLGLSLIVGLAACTATTQAPAADRVTYGGVETRLLDGDLVNFIVTTSGDTSDDATLAYAECAAAQYTLIRGFGFARQIRTTLTRMGGAITADAVYTISPNLPAGLRTIDAEVAVANCGVLGIPTV